MCLSCRLYESETPPLSEEKNRQNGEQNGLYSQMHKRQKKEKKQIDWNSISCLNRLAEVSGEGRVWMQCGSLSAPCAGAEHGEQQQTGGVVLGTALLKLLRGLRSSLRQSKCTHDEVWPRVGGLDQLLCWVKE